MQRSSHAGLDRVELEVLARSRRRDRFQHADARLVELVLVLGLEERVLLRLQDVPRVAPEWNRSGRAHAEHLGDVLRDARRVFLAIEVPDLRGRLHRVTGLGAVDAGSPGTVLPY